MDSITEFAGSAVGQFIAVVIAMGLFFWMAESVAYQHAFGRNWTANVTLAQGTAGVQVGVGAGFGW